MKNFMEEAYKLAMRAKAIGEIPVGALVVKDNKIISKGYNLREKKQNALFHAETIAIYKACKKLKSWRLDTCEMYVTLEPCVMCAGAIANARLKKVFFALEDKMGGGIISKYKILDDNGLNTKIEYEQLHEYREQVYKLLTNFFKGIRKKNN